MSNPTTLKMADTADAENKAEPRLLTTEMFCRVPRIIIMAPRVAKRTMISVKCILNEFSALFLRDAFSGCLTDGSFDVLVGCIDILTGVREVCI